MCKHIAMKLINVLKRISARVSFKLLITQPTFPFENFEKVISKVKVN